MSPQAKSTTTTPRALSHGNGRNNQEWGRERACCPGLPRGPEQAPARTRASERERERERLLDRGLAAGEDTSLLNDSGRASPRSRRGFKLLLSGESESTVWYKVFFSAKTIRKLLISGVSENTVWYKTNSWHIPHLRANSSDFPKTSF